MQSHSASPQQTFSPVAPFTPVSKEDAASLLRVTERCIEQWVERGEMPRWRKIGHRSYWHPDVFYGWLEARLKSDEGELAEVASARPATVRPKKGKAADSGVQAQNAKRLLRISIAANEATSHHARAA